MRHPAPAFAARLAAAAAATLLAACSDGSTSPDRRPPRAYGESTITASGPVSVSAKGVAFYGTFDEDDAGFTLAMASMAADSSVDHVVVITRERAGAPGVGGYPFHDAQSWDEPPAEAFQLGAVFDAGDGRPRYCAATSGTLTVRTASGGRLGGHYSARAICRTADGATDAGEALISGTFDAVDGVAVPGLPRAARQAAPATAARLARQRP